MKTERYLAVPDILEFLPVSPATIYRQIAGVHVKQVSEMLGHASVAITLAIYSHVIPRMHQEAAGRMDDLLRSVRGVSH